MVRFCILALCLVLVDIEKNVEALQAPLQSSIRKDCFQLFAAEGMPESSSSTGEGVLTARALARRIRKSRSTRGRVAMPPKSEEREMSERIPTTSNVTAPAKVAKKNTNRGRPSKGFHIPYESTIDALRVYHAFHKDLAMPRRYVVPEHPDYAKEWHGVDLASTVYEMQWWQKHVKQNPDRVAELNRLGFIWERLQTEWNLVLEALVTYSSMNENVLVPKQFVVPRGDERWPKATWGIPLGRAVFQIRTRNDFIRGTNAESRRAQLDRLGFVWEVNEYLFRKFLRALLHFSKLEQRNLLGTNGIHTPLRVPSTFTVPSGKEHSWPEELWGYPLGAKCNAVRSKELYVKNNSERQAALEQLGFRWSGNATLGWLEVVHAAAIYSRMHQRKLDVPIKFVVPAPPRISHGDGPNQSNSFITGSDDAWPWPQQLWGLPLGQRLKDIRLKGAYLNGNTASARRAQLDGLGFNWTPKLGRRKRPQGGEKDRVIPEMH